MQLTFHVVSLPHTQTSKEYLSCAYTQKVLNFCKMMKSLWHIVYHYGGEWSDVECDEHINIITNKERQKFWWGNDWKKEFYAIERRKDLPYWMKANHTAIAQMSMRIQPKDFICIIGGDCQQSIADAFPNHKSVEFGIWYQWTFSPYKVYESYAHMHRMYWKTGTDNWHFYDAVIPNYFDVQDFPYSKKKDDYFLYIWRLVSRKGVVIASQVAKALWKRLVIAWQWAKSFENGKLVCDEFTLEGDHIDYIWTVWLKERWELMSKAKAIFVPTLYLEPFWGVNVEAQLCGTPVITTDFGAFTETVVHWKTWYRCKTLEQFIRAAKNIDKINPKDCRDWSVNNYSLEKVRDMYNDYFHQLHWLCGKWWDEEDIGRDNLDHLTKIYP